MNKMASDYSMDDEAWNRRVTKVEVFLQSNDVGDLSTVLEWNINTGNNDSDNRKRYWTSITTLLGMLPNSPIQRGRETDLPDAVAQAIRDVKAMVIEKETEHYNNGMATLIEKHGKSGGGLYGSAEEYAEKIGKATATRLTRYYRNHDKKRDGPKWDGTLENGLPTVNYPVISMEAEEEE
jgi:hypothetical protein